LRAYLLRYTLLATIKEVDVGYKKDYATISSGCYTIANEGQAAFLNSGLTTTIG
jgi:hypothetical protein